MALLAKIEEKDIPIEPLTYKKAILDLNWYKSIGEEVKELYNLNMWTIMPLPKDRTALGGRQVYKVKIANINVLNTNKNTKDYIKEEKTYKLKSK